MKSAERGQRAEGRWNASGWRIARSTCPASFGRPAAARQPWPGRVAGEPLILLADEPPGTSIPQRRGRHGSVRELHMGGATICMVTHDPRYARHADRSIHLFDGRVVEEGMEMAAVTE